VRRAARSTAGRLAVNRLESEPQEPDESTLVDVAEGLVGGDLGGVLLERSLSPKGTSLRTYPSSIRFASGRVRLPAGLPIRAASSHSRLQPAPLARPQAYGVVSFIAVGEPEQTPAQEPFRTCGMCRRSWATREEFLEDPALKLLGLQVVAELPDANLIMWEHECGTSVSVLARRLRDLLGPVDGGAWPLPLLLGSKDCQQLCTKLENLGACDRPCRNAFDRRVTAWLVQMVERRGWR